MAAKVAKCLPWQYVEDPMSPVVWIDGSIKIQTSEWLEFMVDNSSGPVSQIAHPLRDDIRDEALASSGLAKYAGQDVLGQADWYLSTGLVKPHSGLWATGLIVYRPWLVPEGFGEAWLLEQLKWTYQDQISETAVANVHDVEIHTIPDSLWHSPHFGIKNHASEL